MAGLTCNKKRGNAPYHLGILCGLDAPRNSVYDEIVMASDYPIMRSRMLDLASPSRCIVDFIEFIQHKAKFPGYVHDNHSHDTHEIIYMDFGQMTLTVAGTPFQLVAGDCFLIPAGTTHLLCGRRAFDYLNITYKGVAFPSISNRILHLSTDEISLLDAIRRETQEKLPHFSELIFLKLSEFLLTLTRKDHLFTRRTSSVILNAKKFRNKIVNKALTYIAENYAKPLDPASVAAYTGVSASHLRYLVRKETGKSLSHHLRRVRFEVACQLLRDSPCNVEEVAYRVGYNSVPHFCTIFKAEFKMTPKEFAGSLGLQHMDA